MINKETLRHVLWNAQDFAQFAFISVHKEGSNVMFDLWPVTKASGKRYVQCMCRYCGMLKGPSCMFRSIPASGTPVALRQRGIDLNDTGWHIDESSLFNALGCIETLIHFKTGKKMEDK